MTERNFRHTVVRSLKPFGIVEPVENSLTDTTGFPDYVYCFRGAAGVLELKFLEECPKRASTPLRIDKLTLEQVLWGERWTGAGGRYRLLLRIGGGNGGYALFDAPGVRALYERTIIRAALPQAAIMWIDEPTFPTLKILRHLTQNSLSVSAGSG